MIGMFVLEGDDCMPEAKHARSHLLRSGLLCGPAFVHCVGMDYFGEQYSLRRYDSYR